MKYEKYKAIRRFERNNKVKPSNIILSDGKALFVYCLNEKDYVVFYVKDETIDFTASFENQDLLGKWKKELSPEWEGALIFFHEDEETDSFIEGNEDLSEDELEDFNAIIDDFEDSTSLIHLGNLDDCFSYYIVDNRLKTFGLDRLIEEPTDANVNFRTYINLSNVKASCKKNRIYLHADECDVAVSCKELSIGEIRTLVK